MRKIKAFTLLIIIFVAFTCTLNIVPSIKADEGYAKVYIICLNDVKYHNFDIPESDEAKTKLKTALLKRSSLKSAIAYHMYIQCLEIPLHTMALAIRS